MNIFVLDSNIQQCAVYHCDQHVCKMILEYAQLLSTVHWQCGKKAPYKATHINHPCSLWARASRENYRWLQLLGKELCGEYTRRYNRVHRTETIIDWLGRYIPPLPNIGMTEFVQAMPDQHKRSDAVEAYRVYYAYDKSRFARWKLGNVPAWYSRLIGE